MKQTEKWHKRDYQDRICRLILLKKMKTQILGGDWGKIFLHVHLGKKLPTGSWLLCSQLNPAPSNRLLLLKDHWSVCSRSNRLNMILRGGFHDAFAKFQTWNLSNPAALQGFCYNKKKNKDVEKKNWMEPVQDAQCWPFFHFTSTSSPHHGV